MISTWLGTDATTVWLVLVSAIAILLTTVLLVRIVGLRSFSKMSTFDFAVTVAVGSVIASVSASATSLANGALALAALLGTQAAIASLRRRTSLERLIDNTPLMLMRDGEFIQPNLTRSRVTEADVIAKLREANCLRLRDCHAVVLETTGDISVLHGDVPPDERLLNGVRGA